MIKNILGNVVVFAAIVIIGFQVDSVRRSLATRQPLEASPVQYSELIPDKTEYAPGDLITFRFDRATKLLNGAPLPMLTNDSFENLTTGEVFSGTFLSRIVRESGTVHLLATRRLSNDATPGNYSFEGWAEVRGTGTYQSIFYSSRKFTVTMKQ